MFAEVESGKSRNVIIVCVCCPEENYIAQIIKLNKVLSYVSFNSDVALKTHWDK